MFISGLPKLLATNVKKKILQRNANCFPIKILVIYWMILMFALEDSYPEIYLKDWRKKSGK